MIPTLLLALAAPDPTVYLKSLSRYPELTEFRNVRETDGVTCGEMKRSWDGKMSGFLPFAFQDTDNFVLQMPGGYMLFERGASESNEEYSWKIRRAVRKLDETGEAVLKKRQADFEARSRAFLNRCPSA